MAQQEFIEKLHDEIAGLKKLLEQQELRQRAKRELFGAMSIERLAEENEQLKDEIVQLKDDVERLLKACRVCDVEHS